jgi:hypothetical protein
MGVDMGVDMNEPTFHLYREMEEYQACKEKFEKVGWVPFLEKFIEHHEGVSRTFDQSYDGERIHLGEIKITITKYSIGEATKLPSIGENYLASSLTRAYVKNY